MLPMIIAYSKPAFKRWLKSCARHDSCIIAVAEVWSGAGKAEQAGQSVGVSAIVGITDQTMVIC